MYYICTMPIIIALVIVNFAIQGFDFLNWQLNPCGYYTYNETCMQLEAFILNKVIRFSLHLLLIAYLFKHKIKLPQKHEISIYISITILAIICISLGFQHTFSANRIYSFLHPLVISPLTALILFGVGRIMKNEL